jgi:hypothetical protein
VRGGAVSVTDGPFAKTREQLAGLHLIDAADQDEAIRPAAQIPPARVGSIEVRPMRAGAAGAGAPHPGAEGGGAGRLSGAARHRGGGAAAAERLPTATTPIPVRYISSP